MKARKKKWDHQYVDKTGWRISVQSARMASVKRVNIALGSDAKSNGLSDSTSLKAVTQKIDEQ